MPLAILAAVLEEAPGLVAALEGTPGSGGGGRPAAAWVGALLALAAVASGLRSALLALRERALERRRCDADAARFRDEVRAAAAAARARLANAPAWPGRRALRVASVVDEAPGVKSFYLVDPSGAPAPRFLPGQHLTLALPAGPDGREIVRCYSLSDRPRTDYYRITVRRVEPRGVASGWLHDRVRPGDELLCEAPRGAFFLDPTSDRPVVLLGAGVGVTPLVSMMLAARDEGRSTPTFACLAFRDGSQKLLADSLDDVSRSPGRVRLRVALTRPRAEDRLGIDYHIRGRIGVDLLRRELPSSNFDFYVCGPAAWMQAIVPDLLAWGVPAEHIHFEAFGPSSVATSPSADPGGPCEVRFGDGDESFVWDGAHGSLLEMAEALGVPVASGCRAGACGACRVRVVEGSTVSRKPPGVPLAAGECLACISVPRGPVRIEP